MQMDWKSLAEGLTLSRPSDCVGSMRSSLREWKCVWGRSLIWCHCESLNKSLWVLTCMCVYILICVWMCVRVSEWVWDGGCLCLWHRMLQSKCSCKTAPCSLVNLRLLTFKKSWLVWVEDWSSELVKLRYNTCSDLYLSWTGCLPGKKGWLRRDRVLDLEKQDVHLEINWQMTVQNLSDNVMKWVIPLHLSFLLTSFWAVFCSCPVAPPAPVSQVAMSWAAWFQTVSVTIRSCWNVSIN